MLRKDSPNREMCLNIVMVLKVLINFENNLKALKKVFKKNHVSQLAVMHWKAFSV